MQSYSPFDKPLGDITAADLNALKSTPEGWYIEYKSQFPDGASVAKSLSAFANSYGGWLFYGIQESADKSRCAGLFPGIPADQLPLYEQKLRQAASGQVSPAPYFETRVVKGPDDAIGLTADRGILVVYIPSGKNAPYVHSSGRIYRRIADSSDPVAETDRHFLDLLWTRGKESRRAFSKFVRRKPEISESESSVSFVRVLLFPDPWRERAIRSHMDFSTFAEIMKKQDLPFDNVFTSSSGYIARQTARNDPNNLVLTWRYYFDCTSEVFIPMNSFQFRDIEKARDFLGGYEHADAFVNFCTTAGFTHGTILDLSILLLALTAISKRRLELYQQGGFFDGDFFKAHLHGMWRKIPFIDVIEMISFITEYGIPVVQHDRTFAPAGDQPDTCFKFQPRQLRDLTDLDLGAAGFYDGCHMLAFVCQALGIPSQVLGVDQQETTGGPHVLARMIELGSRAQQVARNRTQQ